VGEADVFGRRERKKKYFGKKMQTTKKLANENGKFSKKIPAIKRSSAGRGK